MFMDFGRKLLTNGLLRRAINTTTKTAIAQKVTGAVLNGATAATQKATERALTEAVNVIAPHIKKSLSAYKRKTQEVHVPESTTPTTPIAKRTKIDINSLIDGTGIVFD